MWTLVDMCVCVRRALCPPFPLTSKSQAPVLESWLSWPPVAGGAELSPNSLGAVGRDLGRGAALFLCGRMPVLRGLSPSLSWPVAPLCPAPNCSRTVLGVFRALSLSGVQAPDLLPLFCESVVPFCPTPSLPFGKHSGSLARRTSGGSVQLTFIHDTPLPELWALRTGALGREF